MKSKAAIVNGIMNFNFNRQGKTRYYLRVFKWIVLNNIKRLFIKFIKSNSVLGNPYEVQMISTNWLRYKVYAPSSIKKPSNVTGYIRGGDWDNTLVSVSDFKIVQAVKDRVKLGMAWTETEYYIDLKQRVLNGDNPYNINSVDEIKHHFDYIDELINSIQTFGYKSQEDLGSVKSGKFSRVEHEIVVHIDRHGHYMFCDGRRRLAVALALDIDKIPVKINVRHKKWEQFRKEVYWEAKKKGGQVYQPVIHPDLSFVKSKYDNKRIDLIVNDLKLQRDMNSVLDIGAEWGFFCHSLEELGYNCTAVERNIRPLYFLNKFKISLYRSFKVIDKSIFEVQGILKYDIVLALNIFHHFLKTKDLFFELKNLLKRLDAYIMYFSIHNSEEIQMNEAFINFTHIEFIEFIINNSAFSEYRLLGKTNDGRPLYKLWRERKS